jgi:hypothetical protein
MNLIPWHSKLHPKLRFHSLKPEPTSVVSTAATATTAAAGSSAAAALGAVVSPLTHTGAKKVGAGALGGFGTSYPASSSVDKQGIQQAVADLDALTKQKPDASPLR